MANSRFRKVMQNITDWVEHNDPQGDAQAGDEAPERFTMKPGEVEIIRGGGADISRQPGEKRAP